MNLRTWRGARATFRVSSAFGYASCTVGRDGRRTVATRGAPATWDGRPSRRLRLPRAYFLPGVTFVSGLVSGSAEYFFTRLSLMTPDQSMPKQKSYVLPSESV